MKSDKKKFPDFEFLFSEYHQSLCYYAYRFVSDVTVAEDLVQDVFFDLWKNKEKVDLSFSIKPYLYKATYNKSIDYLRKNNMREEKWKQTELINRYNPENYIIEQEETLHLKEMQKEIQHCISKLPPQCKKIFQLSRNKGLKNKEIAEILNISIKAVEKQISKALYEIRSQLRGQGFLQIILLLLINSLLEIGYCLFLSKLYTILFLLR